MAENIYDFITEKENEYALPIKLEEGWDWNMKDHLRRSYLYKNSQFEQENENRHLRPNKNIVLAILNIDYRTEGFDVKDIELYVDNPENYYKSFIVKKFHHKWALKNSMDILIDDLVEERADYGGVLVRKTQEAVPVVVDLRTLCFADQENILANPFCIKHSFSQSQLREMKDAGWGSKEKGATHSIEELIVLAKESNDDKIEVKETHGVLPSEWLRDEFHEIDLEKMDVAQIQVTSEYKDSDGKTVGVTLFKSEEPKLPFKFLKRDKIKNRALGRGGVEELFEAQIWTNWNEIKITEMLDAASKIILQSDDPSIASKHPSGLKGVDNLEIIDIQGERKGISKVDTTPTSLAVFNDAMDRWQNQTQLIGSANDPLIGETPSAGTPFKSLELQTIEGKGIHEYRKGSLAVFVDEIYRDWILPHIKAEITKDQSFLAELSIDELREVSEQIANKKANEKIKDKILKGGLITKEEVETFKQLQAEDFRSTGSKKFIKIIKDDFKDDEIDVFTNIAGKQKNLALMTDKLVNVMRQYLATPEIRQDPEMNKLLNVILESSGLSPVMFSASPQALPQGQPQGQPQAQGGTEPLKQLAEAQQ